MRRHTQSIADQQAQRWFAGGHDCVAQQVSEARQGKFKRGIVDRSGVDAVSREQRPRVRARCADAIGNGSKVGAGE
ncbi:MAG: hypothetical protein BWZ07_02317 [Alphaproteobacteria bacterium ADurb.BinA280]|nr:MAG: hypothetical protein BWZ07_02317 [Alphaproteobacteria bacterium ADurb.BinA280]